jgi:WD40 repeat protein
MIQSHDVIYPRPRVGSSDRHCPRINLEFASNRTQLFSNGSQVCGFSDGMQKRPVFNTSFIWQLSSAWSDRGVWPYCVVFVALCFRRKIRLCACSRGCACLGCEERRNGKLEVLFCERDFRAQSTTKKNRNQVAMWHETGHRSEVTCIVANGDNFAVGYADGSIRLWSASSKSVTVTFNGHRKAVTALAFDRDGTRLASGAMDTEIIVWDIVGEAGLFRYSIVFFIFWNWDHSDLTDFILFKAPGSSRSDIRSFIRLVVFFPVSIYLICLCLARDPSRQCLEGHIHQALGSLHSTLHRNCRRPSERGLGPRRAHRKRFG